MASRKQRERWEDTEGLVDEIKEVLGALPEKSIDFPRLYCQTHGIKIDLSMNVVSDNLGSGLYTDGEDDASYGDAGDDDEEYDSLSRVRHIARPAMSDLLRDMLLCNHDISLGYPKAIIENALASYMAEQAVLRVATVLDNVRYNSLLPADNDYVFEQWVQLAMSVFDEPLLSLPAQIAVMQGTIWQAKRKMINREVKQHYMWVLLGAQGGGKTTFVGRYFTEPLMDARKLNVNFEMLLDARYIAIWRYNFVMFLDEMQNASTSNREAIKSMITASNLVRRPMRTNIDQTIAHNATFIGAANGRFSDLVQDTTGIRRFVPTTVKARLDWAVLEDMLLCDTFKLLWQSVDENNPVNPITAYWQDEIVPLQAANMVGSEPEPG